IECNGCQEWYHAVCINTDFSSAAADSSWRCPRCLGLPQARFPDGWEESIQQPRQPLSISSIPLTLGEGNSTQETGFESRLVDVTTKGHVIEATTTDDVLSFTEVENHSNFEEVAVPEQMYVDVSDSCSDDLIPRTSGLTTAIVISSSEDDSISHPCSPRRSCSPAPKEGAIQYAGCTQTSLLQTIWLDETDDDGQDFQTQIPQQSRKRKQQPPHDENIRTRTGSSPPTALKPMDVRMSINGICCHGEDEFFRTRIQNQQRDAIKSRLQTTTSAALATSLHRDANMKAMDGGNMTSLPSRKLLQQMRYEMNRANDFALDPLQDLQLMSFQICVRN
ncbi:unnamed protein product, partial [Allacma fusca]